MNNWGIPKEIEENVKIRDRFCVYCHAEFQSHSNADRKFKATWEHIDNDRWDDQTIMCINIALCCASCNASKGQKPIRKWFSSEYCKKKGITENTVAEPIKKFLRAFPENKIS